MGTYEPQKPFEKKLRDNVIHSLETQYRNSDSPCLFEFVTTRSYDIKNNGKFVFVFFGFLNGIERVFDVFGEYDTSSFDVTLIERVLVSDEVFAKN